MPAKSKKQQRLIGMAWAYLKGDLPDASEEVKRIADSMKKKDLKEFAETKHKGLPEKVKPKKKKKSKKKKKKSKRKKKSSWDSRLKLLVTALMDLDLAQEANDVEEFMINEDEEEQESYV